MERKAAPVVNVTVNGRVWTRVASLHDSGPDKAVFVLDRDNGSIQFGDGAHGRKPPGGAAIHVSYRLGGGSAGNVSKRIDNQNQANKFWVLTRGNCQGAGWGRRPR